MTVASRKALLLAALALALVRNASAGSISNIKAFLDTCPTSDPAFSQISQDFKIRRNGVLVSTPGCSQPVSQMPIAQYTDELIVFQGLRVIYYMDRGQSGHLPWTSGTLYDWMRSRIGGIDIVQGSGSYCCNHYDGITYIAVGSQDDFNRDFDRQWRGIAGNIDLYAHETRHTDGFGHVSCCGITNGCDETFDPANLSPYGIQWWLNKLWLDGGINVGYSCLTDSEIHEIADWHLSAIELFRARFCTNPPATVARPAMPGGPCASYAAALRALPVVGSTPGANGTFFKTSVQLHNPGSTPIAGQIVFHVSGASGSNSDPALPYSLAPGQTQSIADLLPAMGRSGLGSADIEVTSGLSPVATARVFNDAGAAGTTGFTEEAIRPEQALSAGARGVLLLPPDLTAFRFNIGVRTLELGASIALTVRDAAGVVVATVPRVFPAIYHLQQPAAEFLAGSSPPPGGSVTIEIISGSAIVYGATVDNITGDPSLQIARATP